jgi:ABC-2 type transport system permease protein
VTVAVQQQRAASQSVEHGPANLIRQGFILTVRNVRLAANLGSVVMLLVFPLVFLYGFLAVFGILLRGRGIDYVQYLTPAIVMHWMFNIADTTAFAFAADRRTGMLSRFRSMPMHRGAMIVGRMCADALRALIAVGVIIGAGYVAGFRFHTGPVAIAGFIALSLAVAMTLGVGGSAIGLASTNPEGVAAVVNFPHLLLIMLSTAFVPASAFPAWLQPLVANSPVSVVLKALRTLADGGDLLAAVWPAVLWLGGLLTVFAWLAVRSFRRV